MLRSLLTPLLLIIATATVTPAPGADHASGTCAPKDDRSDRLIANFKAFVGKTDMGGTVEKTTMGLRNVTPSQVVLVTDKAVCARAAAAFETKQLQKRAVYTLYVVSLGSSYAVEDVKMLQPGFETADVFDGNWKYIGVRQVQ
jgi:hypothetical protein